VSASVDWWGEGGLLEKGRGGGGGGGHLDGWDRGKLKLESMIADQ